MTENDISRLNVVSAMVFNALAVQRGSVRHPAV